nr:hypothetical protein Iba_chr13aCG9430 [Ipomoea batatas]
MNLHLPSLLSVRRSSAARSIKGDVGQCNSNGENPGGDGKLPSSLRSLVSRQRSYEPPSPASLNFLLGNIATMDFLPLFSSLDVKSMQQRLCASVVMDILCLCGWASRLCDKAFSNAGSHPLKSTITRTLAVAATSLRSRDHAKPQQAPVRPSGT